MRKQTFVVRAYGYIGFGTTLEEAKAKFFKAGGIKRDLEKAEKNNNCPYIRVDHDEKVEVMWSPDDGGLSVQVNGHGFGGSGEMTEEESAIARTTKYDYLIKGEWKNHRHC